MQDINDKVRVCVGEEIDNGNIDANGLFTTEEMLWICKIMLNKHAIPIDTVFNTLCEVYTIPYDVKKEMKRIINYNK